MAGWSLAYHVTHKSNVANIRRRGLQPGYSRGKLRAIWLSDKPSAALVGHIASAHGWKISDMRVVLVRVIRARCNRHYRANNGLHRNMAYYTGQGISAENILGVSQWSTQCEY